MAESDQCSKPSKISNNTPESKQPHSSNDNEDDDTINNVTQKAQPAVYIEDPSAKRKEEIKHEESYTKIIESIDNIDNASAPREAHNELSYRPYQYLSTAVTRPHLKPNPNGKGILYTAYDDEHKFNYFRYWIGRHGAPFRDEAAAICNDLKCVILRDEYDLDNMREDMMIDEDSIESMILNEEEFTKYKWNRNPLKQNEFRFICCNVIDILPFYKEWIEELQRYQSIQDLDPRIDQKCECLPCPALRRLLIVSKFYIQWMRQNFNDQLEPRCTFHFSVHDFMDCLEHYNSVEFQNDYQHLQHCHIEPINRANKNTFDDQEEDDEDDDEDEDEDEEEEEEDAGDKERKDGNEVVLDSENRNIYEWFEDMLGECAVEKCAIFERTYRSRYDSHFENESDKYYVLNDKEKRDWLERVNEVQYQRIFDGMHTILFHSSARFDCMGLGNSEEHRKFVMLSTQKRKEIKAKSASQKQHDSHYRGYTMPAPNKVLFK